RAHGADSVCSNLRTSRMPSKHNLIMRSHSAWSASATQSLAWDCPHHQSPNHRVRKECCRDAGSFAASHRHSEILASCVRVTLLVSADCGQLWAALSSEADDMKPMDDKHFAVLRRHMIEVIGIH